MGYALVCMCIVYVRRRALWASGINYIGPRSDIECYLYNAFIDLYA